MDLKINNKENRENARHVKYALELSSWKKRYIKCISESGLEKNTLINYTNTIYKLETLEKTYIKKIKDINGNKIPQTIEDNFNYKNLSLILMGFASSSTHVYKTYFTIVADFIKFCITRGKLPESSAGILKSLSEKDPFIFVNKSKYKNKYINEFELYTALSELENPMDKAMLGLVFEGVRGKENRDLSNLMKEYIDEFNSLLNYKEVVDIKIDEFNKEQEVTKDKSIELNSELLDILIATCEQKEYKNLNNLANERNSDKISALSQIVESPYLFRPCLIASAKLQKKNENPDKMPGMNIQKRILQALKKYLGYNFITVNSLYTSGVLNRAVKHTRKDFGGKIMDKTDFINYIIKNEEGYSLSTAYRLYASYNDFFEYFINGVIFYQD